MFTLIKGLPAFVVGITATGEVTKDNYEEVLFPALAQVGKDYIAINFLMVIDTELRNFTTAAWIKDIEVNLSHYLKWNKIAMVTDNTALNVSTILFNLIIPGEVKRFSSNELRKAKQWISQVD